MVSQVWHIEKTEKKPNLNQREEFHYKPNSHKQVHPYQNSLLALLGQWSFF